MLQLHRGRLMGWGLCCALLLSCADKDAPQPPRPSVTLARERLYPYQFEPQRSLRALDLLEQFLEEQVDSREAVLARWLVERTHLDMLTRVLTARSQGEDEEAKALEAILRQRLGLAPLPTVVEGQVSAGDSGDMAAASLSETPWGNAAELASMKEVAACVAERLGKEQARGPLAEEMSAAQSFAQTLAHYQGGCCEQLDAIARSHSEISHNARLLMGASALFSLRALRSVEPLEQPRFMAEHYAFPCPKGFAAFAAGDHSLDACDFRCPRAQALGATGKEALLAACGPRHFGFADLEDAAYLGAENYVLVRALSHMSDNLQRLRTDFEASPAYALHQSFLDALQAELEQLCLSVQWPMLETSGAELELPSLALDQAARPDTAASIILTSKAIFVGLPARFRLDRGGLSIPEAELGYRFPGRLVAELDEQRKLPPEALDRGRLARMGPSLDDLIRDRGALDVERRACARRAALSGKGAAKPAARERELHWTSLLVDRRLCFGVIRRALRSSLGHGEHLFEWVLFSPLLGAAAAFRFDTLAGPPPLDRALLRLQGDSYVLTSVRKNRRTYQGVYGADNWNTLYRDLCTVIAPGEAIAVQAEDGVLSGQLALAMALAGAASCASRPEQAPASLEAALAGCEANAEDAVLPLLAVPVR
ncbi:MAG: hypothetical protein RBU37_05055 [Myxococcota bacterium]|nr:hypothetical protein [Myxococcota bacterium]